MIRPSDTTAPYFPLAVEVRHKAATRTIDADASLGWLRRALPIVLAHRGLFGLGLATSVAAVMVNVAIPMVMMEGIDHALVKRTSSIVPYVALFAGLSLARGAINLVSRYCLFRTAYQIEYDLRTLMYEHLSWMPFSFYDRVQSGQLISRANSDIRSVQMYLTFAPNIIVQCLSVVFAFALMLSINVRLAVVAMVTMPSVLVCSILLRKRIFPISWVAQARLADVATIVDESVNGVRVVKAFAAERRQLSELDLASRRVQWAFIRDIDIRARIAPLIENLPRFGLAFILLYGGYLAVHGQATVGTVVAFNAYILQLQTPFRIVGTLMMLGQRARASAGRIYEVLDERSDIVDGPGAVDLVDCRGEVVFDHVTFAYGDGPTVLNGLSFRVEPGQTIALVGSVGSGKTTVTRLIPRFYDVREGAVTVDGTDVRNLTAASLRSAVGVVVNEPFLFSASVRDNIAFARPSASLEDVIAASRMAGAHEYIVDLDGGYDSIIGERGFTLSGGQRQRLAIARAILADPPILILDDATSAVDVHLEQHIHESLRTLLRGRTTIIVAHRLSTIALADRVVVIEDGRVLAQGTHTQLLETEPRYVEILGRASHESLSGRRQEAAGEVEIADAIQDADPLALLENSVSLSQLE
jgi:ATP-binding cassette subfamily B protein